MGYRYRVAFVAFVSACVTLGVPGPLTAAEYVSRTEAAGIPVEGFVAPGQAVAREVVLPWRANMVGLSFEAFDASGDGISIRVQTVSDGAWGKWRDIEVQTEDAPDGTEAALASGRLATDPVWVGLSARMRVSIKVDAGTAPIRDVRLEALNTAGDSRPLNPLTRAFRVAWSYLNATPAEAEAHTGQPKIIRRAQWGADERMRGNGPGLAPSAKMAFIHHTDNGNRYSKSQSRALVRGIYRYHTSNRGYSDIAYNFLIDRYGQIFEGRAGGITKPVIGAHTKGFNAGTIGIALIGNFSNARPPSAMLTSLKRLVAWRLDIAHIQPDGLVSLVSAGNERYARGRVVRFRRISGHRNAKPTACPGNSAYRLLDSVRRSAAVLGRPKIYLSGPFAGVLRPDGDGVAEAMRFLARFSNEVEWKLSLSGRGSEPVRTFTGSGTVLDQRWNGTDPAGARVPTGLYRWNLYAKDGAGHSARSASGSVYVVGDHPDGTLLRDGDGRYVTLGALLYEVDEVAYLSTFGKLVPVATGPSERKRYTPALGALAPRAGALLRGPDGARYIWTGTTLRRFAVEPEDVFTALGYRAEALIAVDQSVIDSLPPGPGVDDTVLHPDGTAIADGAATFVVENAQIRPISALARASRYRAAEVVPATKGDLSLATGTEFPVRDGALLADPAGGYPWIVDQGARRQFITWGMFTAMGYIPAMRLHPSVSDFNSLPEGETLG